MAAIGMEVASQVAGGALLGWLVDSLAGTSRWLLIGAIVGLIVGMWTLIKQSLKLNTQLEALGPRKRDLQSHQSQVGSGSAVDGSEAQEVDDALGGEEQNDEALPSWREEWEQWKEQDDGIERDKPHN